MDTFITSGKKSPAGLRILTEVRLGVAGSVIYSICLQQLFVNQFIKILCNSVRGSQRDSKQNLFLLGFKYQKNYLRSCNENLHKKLKRLTLCAMEMRLKEV